MIHRSWFVRSLRRQASRSLAPLAIAAALVAGCGGGEAEPEPEPIDALARYLHDETPGQIVFADLATAREQLGLPADADALPFELISDRDYDPEAPQGRLFDIARFAIQRLAQLEETLEPMPVTEAFDAGAITAAASSGTRAGPITAIRTSQPFDELARALTALGYERNGTILSKPGAEINEIADAGAGVVVISGDGASAADAVADPPGGPPAALALLEGADEPVADAYAGLPPTENCVTGLGGWTKADGSACVFRIEVEGSADAARVEPEGIERFTATETGEPSADGNAVSIPFTGGGEDGAFPLRDLEVGSLGQHIYDCE